MCCHTHVLSKPYHRTKAGSRLSFLLNARKRSWRSSRKHQARRKAKAKYWGNSWDLSTLTSDCKTLGSNSKCLWRHVQRQAYKDKRLNWWTLWSILDIQMCYWFSLSQSPEMGNSEKSDFLKWTHVWSCTMTFNFVFIMFLQKILQRTISECCKKNSHTDSFAAKFWRKKGFRLKGKKLKSINFKISIKHQHFDSTWASKSLPSLASESRRRDQNYTS